MAANYPNEMTEPKGLPGLLFPFVPHSIETGNLQDSCNEMGGFPVYSVQGETGKVWASKPAEVSAVKRSLTVTIAGTVAEGDKYSITLGTTKYEVTVGASPNNTATKAAEALVSAITDASTGDANFTASNSSGVVTLTAKEYGSAANQISVTADKTSTAGTITVQAAGSQTNGVDGKAGGVFAGIASFTTAEMLHTGYEAGDSVNVLKKGRVWVKVAGEVQSGQSAYINDSTGKITANSSSATAISGGVFKSNAADGTLAELEIA